MNFELKDQRPIVQKICPVRQPKHDFWSNLAKKVPQWVLIDLISWEHVQSESEGCRAGTFGRFSEIDDLCGTWYIFFQQNLNN